MKTSIPFQKMQADTPLQVIRLRDFDHPPDAYLPHRHVFFMLLWTTQGKGQHRIGYRDYDLLPGRIFFTHEGQVHQILQYPEDGWILLFQPHLFREYLQHHPHEDQYGLFDFFNREPFVELNERVAGIFAALIPLIAEEVAADPFGRCLYHNLSVLLCQANRLYVNPATTVENPAETETLRKLKLLINEHFPTQREASFYSNVLGFSNRKLNTLTKQAMGKLVHQLVADRLLSESEYLLGSTKLLMKEIIIELGFADHAHFAYFFKKQKGLTPSQFRQQMHALHTNKAPST